MINQNGFTLVEIIIVIAIVGLILSFGMGIDLSAFNRNTFQAEEATIVSVLERARSRAMANLSDDAHGVCYVDPNYVIFQEDDGCDETAPASELIPANVDIATTSDFSDFPVVFNRLAGTVTGATIDIEVKDGIKSAHIIISNEGTINW